MHAMRRNSGKRRWSSLAAIVALCAALCGEAAAQSLSILNSDWGKAWVQAESGGNQYARAKGSTAVGSAQMTVGAFADAGLVTKASALAAGKANDWSLAQFNSNPYGITDVNQLLNNKEAYDHYTEIAMEQWMQRAQQLQGQYGSQWDLGALMTCEGYFGPGGCQQYLATGHSGMGDKVDAVGLQRMTNASHYSVTGSGDGDQNPNAPTIPTPPGQGNSVGLYCDPNISQTLAKNGAATVENWRMLAMRPDTGYSLLGGQGVLQAAGLDGTTSTGPFGGSDFGQMSCLSRLLGSGVNILFEPPSIGDILGTLEQAVCNQAQQLFAQVTQPLSQSLYQSMDLGGFMPGLGLGSIGGGVNVNVGGGSGPGINVSGLNGFQNLLGGGSGGSGYSTYTGSSYGPLFYQGQQGSTGGGLTSFFGNLF